MRKIFYLLVVFLWIGGSLVGCNLPFLQENTEGAVQTAAALTVEAQLSPIAIGSATSTFTPVPFPTLPPASTLPPANTLPPAATATSNCDNASFVADVTIPDKTVIGAGDSFTKTWRLKNIGACSWTPSYALVFISGASMSGPAVQALVGNVNPGQTVDVSVNLNAPAADGTYTGNWGLRNAAGVIFSHFYVQIVVGTGGTAGPFAVTHVTYVLSSWSDSGHTNCPRVKANITTNGAGTVTYKWTRQDVPGGGSPETIDFTSAGTKTINYDWSRGSTLAGTATWVGMYVDNPNHQDFGQLEFDTACTSP